VVKVLKTGETGIVGSYENWNKYRYYTIKKSE
jgi:hypothetical protein